MIDGFQKVVATKGLIAWRSGLATRALVGIMAGRDKIISHVRVLDTGGAQLASFEVESTNTTAWGTTGGLHQKHAEEIVLRLKG